MNTKKPITLVRCKQPEQVRCSLRTVAYYLQGKDVTLYQTCGGITGMMPTKLCRFAKVFDPLTDSTKKYPR